MTTGQSAENVENAALLVISTAIKGDNPEGLPPESGLYQCPPRRNARELMRLCWSIAVAGTHGKTTTTSLIATLLNSADIGPTVINGGIITGWGSNA